jgi:biotin operon repressor
MQAMRNRRYPISGATLAQELGISTRTLYRDIATLQEQGAHIDGEPGVGYVLRPGFMLPPLMFSEEEIEAIVVGSRWVAKRTDDKLAEAARNALAKIAAVLPDDLRRELANSTLLVPPRMALGQAARNWRRFVKPFAPAGRLRCATGTLKGGNRHGPSGRSRSHFSKRYACWQRGASFARTIGISAWIGSRL